MKLGRAAKFSSVSAAAAIGCAGTTTSDTAARADAAGGYLTRRIALAQCWHCQYDRT